MPADSSYAGFGSVLALFGSESNVSYASVAAVYCLLLIGLLSLQLN